MHFPPFRRGLTQSQRRGPCASTDPGTPGGRERETGRKASGDGGPARARGHRNHLERCFRVRARCRPSPSGTVEVWLRWFPRAWLLTRMCCRCCALPLCVMVPLLRRLWGLLPAAELLSNLIISHPGVVAFRPLRSELGQLSDLRADSTHPPGKRDSSFRHMRLRLPASSPARTRSARGPRAGRPPAAR